MGPRTASHRRAQPAQVAAGLVVVGSVIVAISGFFVWLEVLGSELTGYRLAELISDFGDELSGVPPGWVGVSWYLFPALAAVCWLLVFRHSPPGATVTHVGLGALIAVGAACYLIFVDVHTGPTLALGGGLLVAVGGLAAQRQA